MILDDADTTLKRLDSEFAEKSDAVEKLDSELADKTSELETVEKKLSADQQLIQQSAEKVTALIEIDSTDVKHKALSDKVTLSADDYEMLADLARKQIAAEKDNSDLAEAVDKLTTQNNELSEQVAKLREQNNRLDAERSTLQKTVDGLRNTLRSVQEELSFWKIRFSRVMEFLEQHSLRKKWEEWGKTKKNKAR